jgi:hypothetical protein
MMRFPGTVKVRTFLFAAGLFAVAASPLVAQQDSIRTSVEETGATPVSAPATTLPGPRVRSELRRAEASVSASRESAYRYHDNTTITVTTLVLVLAVVILVLLIAR